MQCTKIGWCSTMSITVRDCLKLPSLRNAEVLAGHAGLDQYVSTVSVLEYAKTFAMANPLFLGNEIILTAFISIKDDVDAQCEAIRRLHAVGEAAIVLYYVGYYMENVDQKLVQVANELDFPLIVMPRNDYSLRYSDVITEVLMHIFRDQQNETRFATQLLRQISMMREQQRSISGILRLLSDRCQYTFLLVDEDGKECGFAPWPMSINEEFRNSVYDHIDESDDFPVTFLWKDCNYVICKNSFATKMKSRFTLFSIMAAGTTEDTKLLQASEVLQSSYDIWDDDLRKKTQDDLVRMVLVEPADEVYRFANSMRLDLHPLRIMWVICPSPAEKYTYGSADRANIKYEIKKHLRANRKTGIVDTFDNSVVAFMNDDKYLEFDKDLCESLTKYLQEQYPGMILTWCGALDSITDAKRAYLLLEEYFPTACAIYAHKTVLTQRELSFAGNCHDTLHRATVLPEKYRLTTGLIGVAGLTTMMVAAAKAMSSNSKTIIKGATQMVIFAAAIKILASVCEQLAKLDWNQLAKGLVGVGVLLAEVSLFLRTAKFSGKSITTATGIVILSAAIKVLASACKDFGEMKWEEIGKGLASIAVLLAEVTAFTKLTGNAMVGPFYANLNNTASNSNSNNGAALSYP